MNIKIVPDENAPGPIIRALRVAGFTIAAPLLGATDVAILKAAFDNDAVILTQDKDFPKLVLHDRHRCHGLIILRFPDQGIWTARAPNVVSALQILGDRLRGHITEISPTGPVQQLIP